MSGERTTSGSTLFGEGSPIDGKTPIRTEGRPAAENRGKPAEGGSGVAVGSGAGAGGGGPEDPDTDRQSGGGTPAT